YKQLSQQQKNLPPLSAIKAQILERLIMENLQLQLAQRASVTISRDELQEALIGIARQNKIDIKELKNHIEREGMSFSNFQKNIENEILLQRIQQIAVSKRIDISEQDITNFINSEEGKIRFSDAFHIAHIVLSYTPDADDAAREKTRQLADRIIAQLRAGHS